jgi:Domain of unknown function (DUF6895)
VSQLGAERHWAPPPLDTAALLRRGQGLMSADAAPVVPSLCLRLTRYAHHFDPCTAQSPVQDWAAACYERWLEQLARDEPTTVRTTLATDPANLVLGAKALPDPALSDRCIRAQLDLYERARTSLPRLNQTVLGALLKSDGPRPAPHLLADPLSDAELLAEPSPTTLAALGLASRRKASSTAVSTGLVAALALRSVWMRDLSGVGLTLLGAALLHLPVSSGLLSWVTRIARDDGFYGMWELYADPHPVANLLGTVNLYWGLSALAADREVPSRPTVASPESEVPSRTKVSDALGQAQGWLDHHQDRFALLPACRDEDHFESTFKPLVELALLCYVLTRPRHDESTTARWARQTAERLYPHIEWQGLIEAFRLQTSATLGVGIYPLLQIATGRDCRFASQARQIVDDPFARVQERTPMREMDYQFTRSLMGLPMTLGLPDQLSRTLVRAPFDPMLLDTDSLYDLTHIVFYATQFGCVPWKPPASVATVWPSDALESMTLARLMMGDADLGAELLLTQLYVGETAGALRPRCLCLLLSTQAPNGSFAGVGMTDEGADAFSSRYHATIVAAAALAESLIWLRD